MAKHIGAEQSCGTVDALCIGIKGAVKNLSSGKPIMAIRFTANGCNLSSDLQKYWPIRFSFLYTARCLIGTKLELKRQIYTESLVTLRCFPESFLWSGSFFFKDAESHNACAIPVNSLHEWLYGSILVWRRSEKLRLRSTKWGSVNLTLSSQTTNSLRWNDE
jgi:hypothetical protein